MTKLLNPVQLKVASLNVDKTIFIHPRIDARKLLEMKLEERLFSFSMEGADYLITGSQDGNSATNNYLFKIFVKNGDSWISSTIFLTEWEWKYLVSGYEAVNAENYHAFSTNRSGKVEFFHSENQVNETLKEWEEKGDPEMVEHIRGCYKPMRITKDGIWEDPSQPFSKPRCGHCFSDLTEDYSVKRTYANKDGGDDVVVEGRYDEALNFESHNSEGINGGRIDSDDSDICINCGKSL